MGSGAPPLEITQSYRDNGFQSQSNKDQRISSDTTYDEAFTSRLLPQSHYPAPAPTDFDFEAQFSSWLINNDFDNYAFDSHLLTSMVELGPAWPENPPVTSRTSDKPLASIRSLWFTNINEPRVDQSISGVATPVMHQQRIEVDDDYRQALNRRLQIRPLEHSLPSAEFLNLCVRSYFTRCHPVFPVVHAPTFRPSKANSILLLSICSMGSLFTGSASAVQQGTQIFERLHKAILANWERLMARGPEEVVSMVQAALIGQTFGLLSGDARHLAIMDAFHGTVISWARRSKMFDTRHTIQLEPGLSGQDLDYRWQEWARTEELIRITLGLYIHDAELASIFHHEPLLRHSVRRLPIAASNAVFMASKPQDWASQYINEPTTRFQQSSSTASADTLDNQRLLNLPATNIFTNYTALEGISVTIIEARMSGSLSGSLIKTIQDLLLDFHERLLPSAISPHPDHLGMRILWHLTFMSLFSDFDLLEKAIGREGPSFTNEEHNRISEWANSAPAKRCVAHGLLIQKRLEIFSLGFEPALHVPRAMFLAAVCFFCYSKFGTHDDATFENLDFPEFKLLGTNTASLLFEANGYRYGRPAAIEANGLLCGLTDLLQRIGHWEIARKFASILGALIHNESN